VDGFAAGLGRGPHGSQGPGGFVVVVQVLIREAAKVCQEGLWEQAALLEAGQRAGVGEQVREHVPAGGLQPFRI